MGQCLSRKQGWQSVWANTQPGNKGDKMWGPTPSQETRVTKCEGQRSARKQGWQQCMGYRSPRKQFLADRLSGGQCFLVDRLWVVDSHLGISDIWISAFCIHFCECLWAFKQMWEQVVGIYFSSVHVLAYCSGVASSLFDAGQWTDLKLLSWQR